MQSFADALVSNIDSTYANKEVSTKMSGAISQFLEKELISANGKQRDAIAQIDQTQRTAKRRAKVKASMYNSIIFFICLIVISSSYHLLMHVLGGDNSATRAAALLVRGVAGLLVLAATAWFTYTVVTINHLS